MRRCLVVLAGGLLSLASCAQRNEASAPASAAARATPSEIAIAEEVPPEVLFPKPSPGGIGSLTARTDQGEQGLIELESAVVRASQAGDLAVVEVEHVFRSDADARLEGTFRFPLPEDAIVTGLSLWIDGKEMQGELVEREKARRVFEEIVDAMQDPALLEWEHGTTFKMRVFPIEPHEKKTVTLRYLSPLRKTPKGLVFAHGVKSPSGGAARHLVVTWEGKSVFDEVNVAPERVVEIPAAPAPRVLAEERADGAYRVVRVAPDWSKVPRDGRKAAKSWVVVLDTSRSALEERKLMHETLKTVLSSLPRGSRFVVVASDVDARVDPRGFAPADAASVDAAMRFADGVENDGATDVGAALETAATALGGDEDAAVVYLGDAEPTWGEVRPTTLAARAKELLPGVPLDVVLFGAGEGSDVANALVDGTGGRLLSARHPEEIAAFAKNLSKPARRIDAVTASVDGEATVVAGDRTSLAPGEELTLAVRAEPGKPFPRRLTVSGTAAGKPLHFDVSLDASPSRFVAARFGALRIRQLEKQDRPKEEVVAASLAYHVMSKYTSFLVLESEEAYAEFAIARQAAKETPDAPRVTGADLESSADDGVSINLDRVQPGDPEIYVDAPEDALSVTVTFPFGETKEARYDTEANDGRGAWMVRFLVPRETAEGPYEAGVRILHRDGNLEVRSVKYTVDRTAPELEVAVRRLPGRPGFVALRVTAKGPAEAVDLRRVEVRLPSGDIVELTAVRWGEFTGTFRVDAGDAPPRVTTPPGELRLRVVGVDQALNHAALDVVLP